MLINCDAINQLYKLLVHVHSHRKTLFFKQSQTDWVAKQKSIDSQAKLQSNEKIQFIEWSCPNWDFETRISAVQ